MRKTVSESLTLYMVDGFNYRFVTVKAWYGLWYVEYDSEGVLVSYKDRQSAEEDVEEAYGYS